jgi:hypothetical protein
LLAEPLDPDRLADTKLVIGTPQQLFTGSEGAL